MSAIELQGHRGAMGSAPENTLPSFEIALDCGVTSIETDVHLMRDDVQRSIGAGARTCAKEFPADFVQPTGATGPHPHTRL